MPCRYPHGSRVPRRCASCRRSYGKSSPLRQRSSHETASTACGVPATPQANGRPALRRRQRLRRSCRRCHPRAGGGGRTDGGRAQDRILAGAGLGLVAWPSPRRESRCRGTALFFARLPRSSADGKKKGRRLVPGPSRTQMVGRAAGAGYEGKHPARVLSPRGWCGLSGRLRTRKRSTREYARAR